jgi:hypothetical protein
MSSSKLHNLSEKLWENVSSKLHLDGTLMLEEFNGVDNNLKTDPLLANSAILESII